jgi:hypothetical protein
MLVSFSMLRYELSSDEEKSTSADTLFAAPIYLFVWSCAPPRRESRPLFCNQTCNLHEEVDDAGHQRTHSEDPLIIQPGRDRLFSPQAR